MDANTYWVDSRLNSQQITARGAVALHSPNFDGYVVALPLHQNGERAQKRRRYNLFSSWCAFAVIVAATFALCITVTKRTGADFNLAAQKYETLNREVTAMRRSNAALAREIERLKSDPRAIEVAARERLKMVRADEIVVPIK
jgi:cell division protein FtsB